MAPADDGLVQLDGRVHPPDVGVLSEEKGSHEKMRAIILRLERVHVFVLHLLVVGISGVGVVELHFGNLLRLKVKL